MKLDANQPLKSAPSPTSEGGRGPASQSQRQSAGPTAPNTAQSLRSGHHSENPNQQAVSNQDNPKLAESRSNSDQPSSTKADSQYVVEKTRPLTQSEQRALLALLPKEIANQLKQQLSRQPGPPHETNTGKLHLVQAVGPNGHKNFTSIKPYEVGQRLDLQQGADATRAAGEAQPKPQVEQWQTARPLEASKLNNILRQYQPLISKVADILVQDIQQALSGTIKEGTAKEGTAKEGTAKEGAAKEGTVKEGSLKPVNPNLGQPGTGTPQPQNIKQSEIAAAETASTQKGQPASTEQPPSKVESIKVHYPVKEAKTPTQGKDWMVVLLQPTKSSDLSQQTGNKSTETIQPMKVPPSNHNDRQPTSQPSANKGEQTSAVDSASRAQETSNTSRNISQLSQAQIQQLKNQWVEVANVKVLEAKDQTQWRQQLQATLPSDNKQVTKGAEQTLYQIQLKTPIGQLQVISPTQYKPGELIQLQLAELTQTQSQTSVKSENSLLQLLALRQSAQQNLNPALANALRQYQPIKSAMQMLALQHIEAGKMQALAASTRDQLTQFIIPSSKSQKGHPANTAAAGSLISNLNQADNQSKLQQLKQVAQQLLNNSALAKQNASITKASDNISNPTHSAGTQAVTKLPNTLINANNQITSTDIRQALQQAGQELESNLKKLAELPAQSVRQDQANKLNVQRGFGEINQNIQAGIKEWLKDLTGKGKTPQQAPMDKQINNPANQSSVNPNTVIKSTDNLQPPLQSLKQLTDAVKNDMKSWLMQNQVQLMQVIQNDPNGRADQKQLMDGLLRVIFPKQAGFSTASSEGGEPVIPKNLSVQPHLQRLFTQLLGQQSDSQGQDDSQQLRQLLNLTQNLTRLQQDQVLNRNQQVQQPDSPDFQMSLPYLHDKQIQWCELECNQQETKPNEKNSKRGWHIILRFAQDNSNAFAVEANLVGNQLVLSLWSEQQTRLQQLNQFMDLLKSKVQKAGFVCEQIQSKHGMPAKKQRQIQQGLVDVRT